MTSPETVSYTKKRIFRYGDLPLFPGAREMFFSSMGSYYWKILIPFDKWLVEISAMAANFENIDKVFYPIVASIVFDPLQFPMDSGEYRLKIIEGKKIYRWANISPDKSKSLKRKMDIGFSALAFYDSALEYDYRIGFTQSSVTQRIFKQKEAATLLIANQSELDLSVNFNKKAPKETDKKWDHIIEGIIAVNSGKMFISNYEAEIKIALSPGNYKFRVYFGNLDPRKNQNEKCGIYIWPTNEPETNDIAVIKQYVETR